MAEKEERFTNQLSGNVPEHGVVRKRSIRRKISRDETITEVRYGRFPDEYDKIYERVTSEKHFRNALEVLEERWRMIMFMYEDCQELVKEWEGRHLKRKQDRAKQRLYVYLSVASIVIVPLLLLVVIICWHLL